MSPAACSATPPTAAMSVVFVCVGPFLKKSKTNHPSGLNRRSILSDLYTNEFYGTHRIPKGVEWNPQTESFEWKNPSFDLSYQLKWEKEFSLSSEFNENNFSSKMNKSIQSFKKDISTY